MKAQNPFPRTVAEFEQAFATEAACLDYLAHLRWPHGTRCTRAGCDSTRFWPLNSQRWECAVCGSQVSVTSGTMFHRSHLSIQKWFTAVLWITMEPGISARQLREALGCSYQTAWKCLQKLRKAMSCAQSGKLSGFVEVEAVRIETGMGIHVQDGASRSFIAIAVAWNGDHISDIRMKHISSFSSSNMLQFIRMNVKPGTQIPNSGALVDLPLRERGYRLVRSGPTQAGSPGWNSGVTRVLRLLTRQFKTTHQGVVSPKHLQGYLDEFAFRFGFEHPHSLRELVDGLLLRALAMRPGP